jgi:pantothenate kinase
MVDIRLTRVAKKAADFLDLDLVELCEINKHADLNSQNVEIILVRDIYKPLLRIMGSHQKEMQNWMVSENAHLKGRPKDLIMSPDGLTHIAIYLRRFS